MKLSVTVSVDLDLTSVPIRVAGLFSTDTVGGRLAGISRAFRTLPDLTVRMDLEHLRSPSSEAVHLLHRSVAEVAPGTAMALNRPFRASEPRLAA